ncbi:MAG TPA: hypothetical protein VG892_14270 [Terriglobales bacterium]|jgi:hypothetical protein|nr:hypothetical protein [Terriglobales bacterium]
MMISFCDATIKSARNTAAATLILAGALAFAQGTAPVQDSARGTYQAPLVRIVSPVNGAKMQQNFVQVRWELTNPGVSADASPTYRLQLDARETVTTSATDYTFNGLNPGMHVVAIDLVDANSTPVNGTHAEVRWEVLKEAPTGPSTR